MQLNCTFHANKLICAVRGDGELERSSGEKWVNGTVGCIWMSWYYLMCDTRFTENRCVPEWFRNSDTEIIHRKSFLFFPFLIPKHPTYIMLFRSISPHHTHDVISCTACRLCRQNVCCILFHVTLITAQIIFLNCRVFCLVHGIVSKYAWKKEKGIRQNVGGKI